MINERPATIIACPRCQAPLTLPPATSATADLECPLCKAQFACSTASPREFPAARIVTSVSTSTPSYLDRPLADLSASGVHVFEPGLSKIAATPPAPVPTPPSIPLPALTASSTASPQSLDHYDDVDEELDVEPAASVDLGNPEVDPHAATVAISPGKTVRLHEDLAAAAARAAAPAPHAQAALPSGLPAFSQHPSDEDESTDPEHDSISFAADQFTMKPGPLRRRRKTGVVGMVGIVGGGVIGLLLGGYALLWIRGEAGDLFQMSRWLPPALLPPSMQQATASDAGEKPEKIQEAAFARDDSSPADQGAASAEELATAPQADVRVDDAVVPATAVAALPSETRTEKAPAPAPPVVKWPVTPLIADLHDTKLYSLGELAPTVAVGEEASKTFVAGDLSKRESVRAMGGAYVQLCALAEQSTLTDPADYGAELFTQLALAKVALRSAAIVDRRNDLAVIATRWVQHNGRQNQGVIFVGTVRDLRAIGRWTECQVEIAVGDKTVDVPVVMDRLKFNVGREVGVIGVIVADPQQRIAGYDGEASEVIVAGDAFDPATVVVEEFSAEYMLPGE